MKKRIEQIGFWSGLLAAAATLAYCIVQVLQLYNVLSFPADEKLIYGTSLCIVLPFLFLVLAVHHTRPPEKMFWSHAALLFTTLYAVFVTANYVVQLATVIPLSLQNRLDEVRLLQQTPHSLFWNFDAIGYICMGLAAVVLVPAFRKSGSEKWVRGSLLAHALVTPLISVVYFYPEYSHRLLLLGAPWAITAPLFMFMLAQSFRRKNNRTTGGAQPVSRQKTEQTENPTPNPKAAHHTR